MEFSDIVNMLVEKIKALSSQEKLFIVAIDGRCASGKTTLANELFCRLECNVIHADEFFLQPFQRTKARLSEAGGNLDRERLLSQVLEPLRQKGEACYKPFICHSMSFGDEIRLTEKKITIVEGSYSCHPELIEYYDLTVFLDVDSELQKKRILERNGEEKLKDFLQMWIPLEEKYFKECHTKQKADIVIDT